MALGSYNRSHQRQSYYYHLADTKIYINGLDFESTLGNLTLVTSIEAISINGLDFESTLGNLNIRTNIKIDGLDFLSAVGNVDVTETFSRCYIGHDVSSLFLSKNLSTNPSSIVRKFSFANSEFTDRVTKFPIIKRSYQNVTAQGFVIEVENASQLMNTFIEDRTKFKQDGMIEYGYQATATSADVICLGGGSLLKADYSNSKTKLTFKNRMDTLSKIKVSTDTTSKTGVSYVGSEYNPADIVWDILTSTSFGAQFNTVASYTNAQIHYDSWSLWKTNLASENLTLNGFFSAGDSYQKVLQSIAELTDSAIYVEADNRLYFRRNLVGVESFAGTILDSDIISITAKGEAEDMCNEYVVPTSYTITNNTLVNTPHARLAHKNQASINSFGLVSKEPTTKLVWYTNSANANNLAQRIVSRRREPEVALSVKVPIKYLQQQLGDLMYVTANEVGIEAEAYTLIAETINVEQQTMDLSLSVGHGIAVANMSVFTLGDTTLGTLDNTVGLLA
jgi:hypothetical protein|tara:strand:- start:1437 stop:2957 length:1521 start_codon:yes stop_codon:yes gene_type:complete